jgi:hypothetical protein
VLVLFMAITVVPALALVWLGWRTLEQNERVATTDVEVKANQTKPPARFTEATLLSAMEGAGKLVEDEELREAMRAKGLGTPATRAAIIEGLIFQEYVRRQGRELIATAKHVPGVAFAGLTDEWQLGKLGQSRHVRKPPFSRGCFPLKNSSWCCQCVCLY